MQFDLIDRAILTALQDNGRMTNAELAERVHLSPSACLRRTRLLEESGVIAQTVALLDARLAGFPGTAFVFVTLESQERAALDRFEQAVGQIPEVAECHLLAGQYDYLLRIIYRDSADLERIHSERLTPLPGVFRVQSTLTLRTVKRSTKLPIEARV